jgi:hypothetical protein
MARRDPAAVKLGRKGGVATNQKLEPRGAHGERTQGSPCTLGQKEKGHDMKKGPQHSEEKRKRRSEGMRRSWADPEVRKRRSESVRRAFADPEKRKHISEGLRRALADPAQMAATIYL